MDSNGTVPVRYVIEPSLSRFQVRAFASGMFSAFAHNPTLSVRNFSGEVQFDADRPEAGSLQLTIQAGSLAVTGDVSEKDRREIDRTMRAEVLEIEKHPEISYRSRQISATRAAEGQYQVEISGDLELHGVTRNQPIRAQLRVDGDRLRAYGDFSLRQTDYQIKLVSVAGGTLKVKDELKFSFDIAAQADRN